VTSLPEFAPALLYHAYCERGQCENFINSPYAIRAKKV
jgi:hypothetical protein